MRTATHFSNSVWYVQFGCLLRSRLIAMPLLALALLLQSSPSPAADTATYECKSDLGAKIAGEITAEAAQENPDMAQAMETLTGHYIYSFDFANKRISFRMVDNKGNEYALLGMGQAVKYTTDIKVDGDLVSWTDVINESAEGVMKANYVFNQKTAKMHVVTEIKPATGEAQNLDEDHTCVPYTQKAVK